MGISIITNCIWPLIIIIIIIITYFELFMSNMDDKPQYYIYEIIEIDSVFIVRYIYKSYSLCLWLINTHTSGHELLLSRTMMQLII